MAKVLCVEIGYATIKIAEMDYQRKNPRVYRYFESATPEKVIKDGYLDETKLDIVAGAVKAMLTEHKIRTKRVLFTVFSGKIISREILIPGVKPAQIGAVIQANITEYFPIELDDYKISHLLVKTFHEGEHAGKHKVLIIAAEKALLAGYETLAEKLNLRLVDIDYAGNGIFQATRNSAGSEGILVVRVEDENSIITILKQGTLVLQRNVNIGIHLKDDADVMEENKLQLINTLQRIIDFYSAQNEENTIEKIYLVGNGSKEEQLQKDIENQTMISCRLLDKIRGVHILPAIEDIPVSAFATVVGSGMCSIGLANEKEKERYDTNYLNACILMLVLIVVLSVGLLSLALLPYHMAELEEKEISRKETLYAPAREVYEQYTSLKELHQEISIGRQLTLHSNDGILDFLEELEEMLPVDVEVTEFVSNDTDCVISMCVADKETAAKVIDNLRQFESIKNVTVSSITEEKEKKEEKEGLYQGDSIIYFTVNCTYYERTQTPGTVSDTADVIQETEELPMD